MSLATKNIAAVVIGLGLIFSFAFATPAGAQTMADLQAQIQALLAQIAALQAQIGSGTTGGACFTFTRDHTVGHSGGEVMEIQKFLNNNGFQVAASGAGSPGNETSYFGALTRAAVSKFQAANGISPTAGYWGPITRAKANSMCTTPPGGGTGTPPVTGNGLKVMLASDNPTAGTLVQGQGIGELMRLTFSNPTASEISVTGLSFNRTGASTDSSLGNVYMYQGGARLTDPAGISSSVISFNDASGIFKVPAGGSVTVSLRADLGGSSGGETIGAQLTSVTASGALDSSVSLPLTGTNFLISSATIATATWGSTTPNGGTFAPADDTTVFQNTLTVNNRAADLRSVQFENRGTASDSAFQNFKLFVKGVQVGNVQQISGRKVVFDLSGSPVRLATGGNEIRLVADVVAGSGKNFDFQIRRGTDIHLVDTELNQPLKPSAPSTVTANEIEGVSLSVVKAANSPTGNVAVGATNVLWGRFEFRAAGDNLKIEQLTVDVDTTAGAGMDNVRIMLNGTQVGSTADVAEGGTTISLGSSMILTAGQTAIVEIYGDAKTTAGANYSNGDTVNVGVSVAVADTEGISSGDRISSAIAEVEGNSLTVSSSTLTGTKFSGYGDQTMVAGTNNARLGSFTLSTGSVEGVNVNTIVLNLSSTESGSITDLRLVDNATGQQIGTAKSSPSTANTFSVNLAMGASQTKVIDIYANIKSGAGAGTIIVDLDDTTGGTGATTGQSTTIGSDLTLQTITIGSGTLTVTRDPGTPVNTNVIAGSTMVHVGKFDFAAANSSYTVQEVAVKVPADAATSVANVTLKYKDQSGAEQTVTRSLALSSGAQTHATATFTGLTFYVPLNDSADLDVYVDVPTTTSGAKSGAAISVLLDADEGFKAIDAAGNAYTSLASSDVNSAANSGFGTKYVKRSVPVLARTTTGLGNTVAAGTGLYRFTMTADAAGAIDWREISFEITTTGVTITGWTLHDITGGANVQINDSAVNVSGTTLAICPDASCTIGEAQQIGAGSTKTYELRASSVSGWGNAGDDLTIRFTDDTSEVANAAASALHAGQNMVWSDRSATSHSTTTTDWTNGYLVKDMDNDTRQCQFGTVTTCTP